MSGKLGDIIMRMRVDADGVKHGMKEGEAAVKKYSKEASSSFKAAGMSTKQYSAAMRGVPAQVTDIFTALQGGQRPMTVLIQQGGQLKDMFGGVVPAAKAMVSYLARGLPTMLHPITLITAGLVTLGVAAYQARDQIEQLSKQSIATGGYSGLSSEGIAAIADEVGELTGEYGTARDAALEMVSSGKIGADQMKAATQALTAGVAVTGKKVSEMAGEIIKIADDPLDALIKLNEQYNFLTVDIYKQIAALEDQGKKQEAVTLAFKTFADTFTSRSKDITENLGFIESGWHRVKDAFSSAWTELMKWGREDTVGEKLKAERENLELLQKAWDSGVNRTDSQAGLINKSKAQIALYEGQIKALGGLATAKGKDAQKNKETINSLEEVRKKTSKVTAAKENAAKREFEGLVASLRTEEEAISASYEKSKAIIEKNTAAGSEERADLMGRLDADYEEQLTKLATAKDREFNALKQALRTEEEVIEQSYQNRVRIIVENTEDGSAQQTDLLMRAAEQQKQALAKLNEDDPFKDLTKAVEGWGDEFTDTFVDGMMEGKLAFSDLADSIIRDIMRIIVKKQVLNALGNFPTATSSGSGLFGWIFGGGSSSGDVTAATAPQSSGMGGNLAPMPSFAGGGYTGYGSRIGGIDGKGGFLSILHPNETVIDHARGQSAGGASVSLSVNVINNTSAQVTTHKKQDGSIDVLINAVDEAIADRVGSGIGATSRALQSRYNLKPAVGY